MGQRTGSWDTGHGHLNVGQGNQKQDWAIGHRTAKGHMTGSRDMRQGHRTEDMAMGQDGRHAAGCGACHRTQDTGHAHGPYVMPHGPWPRPMAHGMSCVPWHASVLCPMTLPYAIWPCPVSHSLSCPVARIVAAVPESQTNGGNCRDSARNLQKVCECVATVQY